MWAELVAWAKTHMVGVEPNLADPVDVTIPRCVTDAHAAVAIVREYHARWLEEQARVTGPAASGG